MARSLFFSIAICFLMAVPGLAQDAQEPAQSLLPEINPQDIEIRSQFQARFPGLRRQPILGFNPTPRVFQIDPNRMPFIEDEETVMANLPIGELDRSAPPVYEALGYSSPKNGFARLGFGSYITPEADVYGMAKLGNNNWLSGNVNFTSTDGHLEDRNSSFRLFDGELRSFSNLSDQATLRFNAGAISNFNHLPELAYSTPEIGENQEDPNTRTEVTGFRGGVNLNIQQNSIAGFNMAVQGFANEFDMMSNQPAFEGNSREWGTKTNFELSRLGNNIDEVHRARLRNETGQIDYAGGESHLYTLTNLSFHYERLFNYQTDVKAELGVAGVHDAFTDFTLYLAPRFRINHTLFDGLNIRGELSGAPKHKSVYELYNENRFVDYTSELRHQYEAKALAEVEMEPFMGTKLMGGASFQRTANYMYYVRDSFDDPVAGTVQSYYGVNFRDATFLKLHAGFSQELSPQVFWVSAEGFWQRARLSGDQKIPFIEPYSLKGTLSYRPVKQVMFEGWGEYIGPREDSQGDSLNDFLKVGGRFEISITEEAGIYGKLLNIMNQEYELWRGYPERGFQAFVGFTYLF